MNFDEHYHVDELALRLHCTAESESLLDFSKCVCCHIVRSTMSSLSPRLVTLSQIIDMAVFLYLNYDRA